MECARFLWGLEGFQGYEITIFLLAKRAVQKLAVLYHFLEKKLVPDHGELSLECSKELWQEFVDKFLGDAEKFPLMKNLKGNLAEA